MLVKGAELVIGVMLLLDVTEIDDVKIGELVIGAVLVGADDEVV